MAVYLNPVQIGIKRAPATYWGTTSKIGAVYEIPPSVVQKVGGGVIHFDKVEVEIGKNKEIVFVQRPSGYQDLTDTLNLPDCYPPSAGGLKCKMLNGAITVSGIPIALWVLLPLTKPSGDLNNLKIYLPDLNATFIVSPFGDGVIWGLVSDTGVSLATSGKLDVNKAQWGSFYFPLFIHYFTIFSGEPTSVGRYLVFTVQLGQHREQRVIWTNNISAYPQGDAVVEGYGAIRYYRVTYDTSAFTPMNIVYPQALPSPKVVWVQDANGFLVHHEVNDLTFPERSNNKVPLVLRRCLVFHEPTLSVEGGFTDAETGVKEVSWTLTDGEIVGDELTQFGVGDAVKIVVGTTEFLFRVKGVSIRRSGNQNLREFRVQLEQPLLQTYAVAPVRLNPYLLRVKDVIRAMKCCVHLHFNMSYDALGLSETDIVTLNDEFTLNSLSDWCDLLVKIAGKSYPVRWWVVGKNVVFQTINNAIEFTVPPSAYILEYGIEADTSMPTVGVVGNTIVISPEAATRGVSFRNDGYPISRRVRYRLAGLFFAPANGFVAIQGGDYNGRKAESNEVHWKVIAPSYGETEAVLDIVAV